MPIDEAIEMAFSETVEQPLDPLCKHPDGYGLYEVVLAGEGEPTLVREYRGRDVIPRAMLLIRGGVSKADLDMEPTDIRSFVDPEDEHSRMVVTTDEQAVAAIEGNVEEFEYRRVDDA